MISLVKILFKEFRELDDFREENKAEFWNWAFTNIGIPVMVVLISLFLYILINSFGFVAEPHSRNIVSFKWSGMPAAFQDKFFNGSIPLTAVGLLVSCLFILFKYNVTLEDKLGMKTISRLRDKLMRVVYSLLFISWSLYYVENFDLPKGQPGLAVFGCITVFVLIFAIDLSINIFYMQENFLNTSLMIKSPIDLTTENMKGKRLCKKDLPNG